jgi:hypothetical protein
MSREWKPGDVAMVTTTSGDFLAMREVHGWTFAHPTSYAADGVAITTIHDAGGADLTPRPLVVIDPEDREQVEALASALRSGIEAVLRVSVNDYSLDRIADKVQAALHSLIEPPKPEEPTGLGAVVEAACVHNPVPRTWVRDHDGNWQPRTGGADDWDSLSDVRVLNEGVTA